MERNLVGSTLRKIFPYLVPALLVLAVILIFRIPMHPEKPTQKVFEGLKLQGVGSLCERLWNISDNKTTFYYNNIRWTKVGLVTNSSYDLYVGWQYLDVGYYVIHLARCDREGAFFPVRCTLKAPEGDVIHVYLTDAQTYYTLHYLGADPEAIEIKCYPARGE